MIDFGAKKNGARMIVFREPSGREFMVTVHDKYPDMDDVHIEGRRYIEVSVEMFIALLDKQGIVPVNPNELRTAVFDAE